MATHSLQRKSVSTAAAVPALRKSVSTAAAVSAWRKSILMLALALTFCTGARAQSTITLTNGQTYSNSIYVTSTTIITIASGTATISGQIYGSGYIYKQGAGKVIVTNNSNAFTGVLQIDAGTWQIGNGSNGVFQCALVQINSTSSILRFEPGASTTVAYPIGGTGKVEYKGDSNNKQLSFSTAKTYTGTTTIEAGWLNITHSGTVASGNITVNNVNTGAVIFNAGNNNQTYSGVISGNGQVIKWGAGKLTLTGTNTYTGKTGLYGTVQVGNGTSGSIASTSNVEFGDANAILRFEPGSSGMTFSKVISGPGKVELRDNRVLYLTGENSYTGTTNIETGSDLYIGNGGTSGKVAGNITVNSAGYLNFNRSNEYTYTGVISGGGSVYKLGSGKTILTGVNTYSGSTYVVNGTLQIGNGTSGSIASTLGVALSNTSCILRFEPGADMTFSKVISGQGKVEFKGGISSKRLFFTGENTYTGTTTIETASLLFIGNNGTSGKVTGNIIVNSGAYLCFVRSNEYTYTGIISGAGSVEKDASGKTILTGVNTYTGSTTVYNGTLQIGNGTSGSINSTSGVNLTSTPTILRFEPGADLVFSKVISGSGKVEYKGTSTKRLGFTGENTYTGTTTIEANGYLNIGNGSTTGKVSGNIINNGYFTFNRSNEYTYTGVISGTGQVIKNSSAKTILTGVNIYTGGTVVENGTLQIGNGTSGSIASTSGVSLSSTSSILRFEPGANMTFSKVITGNGKVEYKGTSSKQLIFTGENSYTGTTTVETGGYLRIGNGGTTGKVTGNIINNGGVAFDRSNASTYDGVISGTGGLTQYGTGTLTLGGVNTHTGWAEVYDGTLALSSSGSLAQSSYLGIYAGTFDITAGNKTIKTIYVEGGVINLGSNTLTIGTPGQNDGGGFVEGSFTGTGGSVTKTGSDILSLYNPNTATGTFNLNEGTVDLWANWAGNFNVASGATLEVNQERTIGGTLNLLGGDIHMNLTTSPPSKLIANGAASAVGTNTLHITSGVVTNQVIMQAASGLNNANAFTLNMPGYTAELTATGTLLLLTATIEDLVPPVPGAGVNGAADITSVSLSWSAATDNQTPQDNLRYYVYQSSSNNIATVANCEANGTLLNAGGTVNITGYDVTGLTPKTTYYFNVVVADMANNKAAYTTKELTTLEAPDITPPTPGTGVDGNAGADMAVLFWSAATDDVTPQSELRYFVYQSADDNIATVSGCETNGTLLNAGGTLNLTTYDVTGLTIDVTYYFNVVVADNAGNKAVYNPKGLTTTNDAKVLNVIISPKTVTVLPGQTQQFSVTVIAVGGADESVTWSLIGNESALTTLSAGGFLTVGHNETADPLTIRVTSVLDPTIFDEAIVMTTSTGIAPSSPSEGGDMRVYPNPTSGLLTITCYRHCGLDSQSPDNDEIAGQARNDVRGVEIFDITGRAITTHYLHTHYSLPTMDISYLPVGIYFLRITTDNGTVTKKVVKQ
ncbi:MAG: autotransporter-associated beta strand repeat-containing protein [Bacteroidales bacterium]|nr:autotransporter-associated beta strand repeat-containing protein [Bacteroidales bacterium]